MHLKIIYALLRMRIVANKIVLAYMYTSIARDEAIIWALFFWVANSHIMIIDFTYVLFSKLCLL